MLSSSDQKLSSALATPSDEEWIWLTWYWLFCDAEKPSLREQMPVEYTAELYEISKIVGKYRRSRFDDRRGNGLPSHRNVRVKGLGRRTVA